MSCQPKRIDFDNVREHLEVIDSVYKRQHARAQAMGLKAAIESSVRRRELMREMVEWLDARQDLGELICLSEHGGARLAVMR